MDLYALSRSCHHPDGLVCFSKGSDDMSEYIVGISKPYNKEPETKVTEGLVLDAELLDRVFKVLIITVKCIPHGSRLAFSLALKIVLCKVVAQPDYADVWVRGVLDDQGEGDGVMVSDLSCVGGPRERREQQASPTSSGWCLCKVADGHFTTTLKVLSSSGVASYCDDTIKSLKAKHPYKPPPFMPSIAFSKPPLVAEIDNVSEGSATATDLLKVITSVVNLWLAGRCLPILVEFVASAPLTPLLKPDNRIRPILICIIWRRLVSKVSVKGVGKEMSKYLSDFQFGVGVSGGAEAILHRVNS
ncbi:hypothetical protein Tco_0209662 [Tanacetum coccineum]